MKDPGGEGEGLLAEIFKKKSKGQVFTFCGRGKAFPLTWL